MQQCVLHGALGRMPRCQLSLNYRQFPPGSRRNTHKSRLFWHDEWMRGYSRSEKAGGSLCVSYPFQTSNQVGCFPVSLILQALFRRPGIPSWYVISTGSRKTKGIVDYTLWPDDRVLINTVEQSHCLDPRYYHGPEFSAFSSSVILVRSYSRPIQTQISEQHFQFDILIFWYSDILIFWQIQPCLRPLLSACSPTSSPPNFIDHNYLTRIDVNSHERTNARTHKHTRRS